MAAYDSPLPGDAQEWIRQTTNLTGHLEAQLCPGGRSNLTYRVQDANGHAIIVRRPPQGMVLPTAHDMAREFRFLSALAPLGYPVPTPIAFCDDSSLLGAPFYLMSEAQGLILRNEESAQHLTVATRAAIGPNLIATLALLHSYDPAALGLAGGGDPREYLARQLNRWLRQVTKVTTFAHSVTETVTRVGDELLQQIPATTQIGIVHGDYRLDNVVVNPDGTVQAVLDWEIASIGDPLADIGIFGVYWMDADDTRLNGINSATKLEGFASRAELFALYGELRRIDPARISYYQHFGSWKLACILIGVVERYRMGATGGDSSSVDDYPALIEELLGAAQLSR
ncbi:MAG: phosphotransferase family protein [Ferrimicrobium sp.]